MPAVPRCRAVRGEACGERGSGDRAAALGPGRVGDEHGGATASQVQREGPAQFGEYRRASASVRPSTALRGGMQRVSEEERLLGGEEEVGATAAARTAGSVHGCRAVPRNTAVRRTESATRATRSGPSGPEAPAVSRTSSAASVTASTGGAESRAPAIRGGPKRCRPVGDQ